MKKIDLSGLVAIVTGAANGLGRSHALLLAARGARVVVNDLGTSLHGDGRSSAAADAVVSAIREAGGEAIADANSVDNSEGAHELHRSAMRAFGRVDIVVHSTGILRDASFARATTEDLDAVLRVHLAGPLHLSHAAFPGMRERRYGRIIFTSSVSGVYGNFGQSAYAAGKAGVLGLMHTLAVEGASHNVFSNAIVPTAASRMTAALMTPAMQKAALPEHVSALVGYLSAPGCVLNGLAIAGGVGLYNAVRPIEAKGVSFNPYQPISPDQIAEHIADITDFSQPYWANDVFGAFARVTAQTVKYKSTPRP